MAIAHAAPESTAAFAAARSQLVGVAHRVLGNWHDAEDVVQETWLRWQAHDRSDVRNAPAYLTVTTARLAINAGRSARTRRETQVGPWMPEPADPAADPGRRTESMESLESAILLLLERLTPMEVAAYVLREAFAYPYRQIAEIIGRQETNTRQIVTRARRHVLSERRTKVRVDEHHRLVTAFLGAARRGDFAELEDLFREPEPARRPNRDAGCRTRSDSLSPPVRHCRPGVAFTWAAAPAGIGPVTVVSGADGAAATAPRSTCRR